jgi:hypothetical protein
LKGFIEQGPDLVITELPAAMRRVVYRGQRRLVDGQPVELIEMDDDTPAEMGVPQVRSPAAVAEAK